MADHDGIQSVTRRQVLKGGAAIAALGGVSAFLAACSSSAATAAPASAPAASAPAASAPAASAPAASAALGGSLHIGSNHSDPGEKAGMDAINAAFKTATGIDVVMNTVDHGTFQDQITNYLGGTPDTAYTWFSGFRMKFFADQGLNVPIDDVWATVKDNFTAGFAGSVVGNDGKVYGIPVDYYPWAVFYRKSVFADKGYTIPTTWDELKTLADQDAGRRPDPDRLRRQGRLARHGHVRHPEPAPERLRLPRRPDGWQGEVDGLEGHRRVQEVGGDRSVPREGLRGPHLAAGRGHARPEEGGHVPARPVRLGAVRRDEGPGGHRRPRLLPVPDARDRVRHARTRSTPRSTPGRSRPSPPTSPPRPTPTRRTSSTGPRAPRSC